MCVSVGDLFSEPKMFQLYDKSLLTKITILNELSESNT